MLVTELFIQAGRGVYCKDSASRPLCWQLVSYISIDVDLPINAPAFGGGNTMVLGKPLAWRSRSLDRGITDVKVDALMPSCPRRVQIDWNGNGHGGSGHGLVDGWMIRVGIAHRQRLALDE